MTRTILQIIFITPLVLLFVCLLCVTLFIGWVFQLDDKEKWDLEAGGWM